MARGGWDARGLGLRSSRASVLLDDDGGWSIGRLVGLGLVDCGEELPPRQELIEIDCVVGGGVECGRKR